MRTFLTQFDEIARVGHHTGTRVEPDLALRIAPDGTEYFEHVGFVNLYDRIQAHAESVDIDCILKKCMITGDFSSLNRMQGSYGDFSELPTTYAGMLDMVARAEEYFNALPLAERQKYDYSFGKWLASLDFTGTASAGTSVSDDVDELNPVPEGGVEE